MTPAVQIASSARFAAPQVIGSVRGPPRARSAAPCARTTVRCSSQAHCSRVLSARWSVG